MSNNRLIVKMGSNRVQIRVNTNASLSSDDMIRIVLSKCGIKNDSSTYAVYLVSLPNRVERRFKSNENVILKSESCKRHRVKPEYVIKKLASRLPSSESLQSKSDSDIRPVESLPNQSNVALSTFAGLLKKACTKIGAARRLDTTHTSRAKLLPNDTTTNSCGNSDDEGSIEPCDFSVTSTAKFII